MFVSCGLCWLHPSCGFPVATKAPDSINQSPDEFHLMSCTLYLLWSHLFSHHLGFLFCNFGFSSSSCLRQIVLLLNPYNQTGKQKDVNSSTRGTNEQLKVISNDNGSLASINSKAAKSQDLFCHPVCPWSIMYCDISAGELRHWRESRGCVSVLNRSKAEWASLTQKYEQSARCELALKECTNKAFIDGPGFPLYSCIATKFSTKSVNSCGYIPW